MSLAFLFGGLSKSENGVYFDGFWVIQVREWGSFPLTDHLGGDLDHGRIRRPVGGVKGTLFWDTFWVWTVVVN